MAITIKWALTDGGAAITNDVSHGSGSSGTTLSAKTIFISHNGTNSITNAKLYLAAKSNGYTGSGSPTTDLTEILSWGDQLNTANFGGIQINMDAANSFPNSAWGTVTDRDPTNGFSLRSGVGDTQDNAVALKVSTGVPAEGVIPAGSTPDVSFEFRVKIPSSLATTGTRQFDLRMRYSYTN